MPDTVVVKSAGHLEPTWPLYFVKSIATISPMWPLALLLLATLCLTATGDPRRRLVLLGIGLAPLLAIVAVGTACGQIIAGAQYFMSHLAFCLGVVFVMLLRVEDFGIGVRRPGVFMGILASGLGLAVLHTAITLPATIVVARGQIWLGAPGLDGAHVRIAAGDIGQIGWYTNATILDSSGLVNGLGFARIREPRDRLAAEVAAMGWPDYVVMYSELKEQLFGPKDDLDVRSATGETRRYVPKEVTMLYGSAMTGGVKQWKLWVPQSP